MVGRFNAAFGVLWLSAGMFLLAPVLSLVTSVDRFATNARMSESTPLKIATLAVCACLGLASLGFGAWTRHRLRVRTRDVS